MAAYPRSGVSWGAVFAGAAVAAALTGPRLPMGGRGRGSEDPWRNSAIPNWAEPGNGCAAA